MVNCGFRSLFWQFLILKFQQWILKSPSACPQENIDFCMLPNDISRAAFTAIPVKGYVLPASSFLGTLLANVVMNDEALQTKQRKGLCLLLPWGRAWALPLSAAVTNCATNALCSTQTSTDTRVW
ncbi:hypothetical protein Q9966_004108 [Columba livia]|nr:hypothetical protein Q9966_004108 [Columba livia]